MVVEGLCCGLFCSGRRCTEGLNIEVKRKYDVTGYSFKSRPFLVRLNGRMRVAGSIGFFARNKK